MAKGLVRGSDLARALDDQASTGRRLCSLLIAHGALDFDDAARALGEQRGCPCALAKHLANRDASLTSLISVGVTGFYLLTATVVVFISDAVALRIRDVKELMI